MKRSDFLKAVALTGAATFIKASDGLNILAQSTKNNGAIDMVAVMGGEPTIMFRKAIAELGGISKYVKKGYKVVIKPNIGWDKTPEFAGNTNPELVKELVVQCRAAGAKEVIVFDHTCDDWKKCYKNSGIEDAVNAAGGTMMPADVESYYREVDLPKGRKLKKTKIHSAILDCDVWFNVPVLKNHGGAKMTISMKNHMGIVWDRRYFHNTDLQQCIADVCTLAKRPALNIVDAYRVMKSNGPKGRSLSDVATTKALFISPDIVAADTAAVKFFGQIVSMTVDDVSHIAKAAELNLGSMNIDKMNVKRIKV